MNSTIVSKSFNISNNIKLPKGFKIGRRKKKSFKKSLNGMRLSLTLLHNDGFKKSSPPSLCYILFSQYMMAKFNLKKYKSTEIISSY